MKRKFWLKIRWPSVSIGFSGIEKDIADRGAGWDGLVLGNWYRVFVIIVPNEAQRTPDGRPMRPICRVKDKNGNFKGRYIVTDVGTPVELGQELIVQVTAVGTHVVFATADTVESR